MTRHRLARTALIAYELAVLATLVWLTADSWPRLNWWNWLIVLPINVLLAQIWPLYWGIIKPIFGS